jgi:hypothetical protein
MMVIVVVAATKQAATEVLNDTETIAKSEVCHEKSAL